MPRRKAKPTVRQWAERRAEILQSSHCYIQGEPCRPLASVRPGGAPFEEQDGRCLALDIPSMSNLRLSHRAAKALRDALCAYYERGPLTLQIGEDADGKLRQEERQEPHALKP